MIIIHVSNEEKYSMNFLTKMLLLSSILILSACGVSTGCDDYHSYRHTKVNAPVQVPSDLEQPVNESTAPNASVSDPNTVDRNAAGECLEKPPTL